VSCVKNKNFVKGKKIERRKKKKEGRRGSVFGIVVAFVVAVCKKQFHKKYFL
jgi:hypothetical protein